jgi:CheY-like chemotaxis protein
MSDAMKEKRARRVPPELGRPTAAGPQARPDVGVSAISSIHGGNGSHAHGSTDSEGPAVGDPRAHPTGSSDRILLVEDNPVNQGVTVAMLESLGYCVDVVDNGVEAVITATMVPYRAILMDCQIPVLNGFETTREIRDQYGASRLSPIIAVTSSATEADQQRCLDAGMNGHLSKPLSLESLAAGMARWAPDPSALSVAPVGLPHPTRVVAPPDVAPLSVGGDRPALDADVVRRLERLGAEAGEDLMGQLARLFLADADTRIVALRGALARNDGPALMSIAHTMCGASANLGAADLARLCARLATDGAVSDPETAEALVHAVATELARVRSALGTPVSPSSAWSTSPSPFP